MEYNFHCHTQYCDARANAEEFVISAIEKGFKKLGFSGLAPIPFRSAWNMDEENFDNYLN